MQLQMLPRALKQLQQQVCRMVQSRTAACRHQQLRTLPRALRLCKYQQHQLQMERLPQLHLPLGFLWQQTRLPHLHQTLGLLPQPQQQWRLWQSRRAACRQQMLPLKMLLQLCQALSFLPPQQQQLMLKQPLQWLLCQIS
jgi:hypothetical protein